MTHKTFAISLARQAGVIMRRHFSDEIQKKWKHDDTPVTKADKEINQLVVSAVHKHFPSYGILAEEGGSARLTAEYLWVCDPIDGTLPYSHAIPTSTFSLALVRDGVPILGLLYDPFMDRLYFAEKGNGATLNNRKIRVMRSTVLRKKVIGTVTWPGSTIKFTALDNALFKLGCRPVNMVVTTYFGMLVASGQLIANIFFGSRPWDVAAQKIIIEEAGGKVTDLHGKEQRYDRPARGIIASNGLVHEKLLKIVKRIL